MYRNIVFSCSASLLILTLPCIVAGEDAVSYNVDIQPILQEKSCTGCHSYMNTYSSLISRTSASTETGALLVNTAAPDSSVMLWRLNGEKPDGSSVTRMPQGGAALSEETIALFKTWIEQGAPEDTPVDVEETKAWIEIKQKFKR